MFMTNMVKKSIFNDLTFGNSVSQKSSHFADETVTIRVGDIFSSSGFCVKSDTVCPIRGVA